jgi:hypothetical protein
MQKKEEDCPPLGERVARLEVKMNIIGGACAVILPIVIATLIKVLLLK